jgi:hypothetical protein
MGYAIYEFNGRDCGYAVPAVCEHPNCDAEIDRGISYVCGGTPDSEFGCRLYFCEKHLQYAPNDNGDSVQVCDRCAYRLEHPNDDWKTYPKPYNPKPDVLKWVLWKQRHYSWEQWRQDNKDELKAIDARVDAVDPEELALILEQLEVEGIYEKEPTP